MAEARRTLVDNLRYAADRLGEAGVQMVMEPLNRFDFPGYFVTHSGRALDIIDETGSTNIKLQYDIYHMQRMEGDLAATIERLLPRIGHIQIAGNPGRHEPSVGEINFRYLIERLDALGYEGWIGAEYNPRGRTEDGLGWFSTYRTQKRGLMANAAKPGGPDPRAFLRGLFDAAIAAAAAGRALARFLPPPPQGPHDRRRRRQGGGVDGRRARSGVAGAARRAGRHPLRPSRADPRDRSRRGGASDARRGGRRRGGAHSRARQRA